MLLFFTRAGVPTSPSQAPTAPTGMASYPELHDVPLVLLLTKTSLNVREPFLQGLFPNACQIVDVEQASAVAIMDARVEITRHGNVQNHESSFAAPVDLSIALQRDDRLGGAGSRKNDVRAANGVVELFPRCGLPAARFGYLLSLGLAAIGNPNLLRLQFRQITQGQLPHLARPDHQHFFVVKVIENLPDIVDGRARHGDMSMGNACFVPHPSGHQSRMLEERVKQGADTGALLGDFVGSFHLAGDLPFTDDQTVQARHDAKDMAHCLGVAMDILMGPQSVRGNPTRLREKLSDEITERSGAVGLHLRCVAVS